MRRSDTHDCFPLFKDSNRGRDSASRISATRTFSRARREEPREDFFRPPGNLQLDWRAKVHQRLLHVVPQLTPLGRASVHLLAAFRRLARGGNARGSQVRTRAARLQKLLQSLLVKVGVLVHFGDAIVRARVGSQQRNVVVETIFVVVFFLRKRRLRFSQASRREVRGRPRAVHEPVRRPHRGANLLRKTLVKRAERAVPSRVRTHASRLPGGHLRFPVPPVAALVAEPRVALKCGVRGAPNRRRRFRAQVQRRRVRVETARLTLFGVARVVSVVFALAQCLADRGIAVHERRLQP